MTATVSATLLGTYKSIVRATLFCNLAAVSMDTITVAHQLGVCPDIMFAVLRSDITMISGNPVVALLRSWNASQVIFDAQSTGTAGGALFDIVSELTHSIVR